MIYSFRLDGFDRFFTFLEEEQNLSKINAPSFAQKVCFSCTYPFQAILITIHTIVFQFFRGIVSITTGVLTLDGRKVIDGLNDEISMVIQAIILPILGFLSALCAQKVYFYLASMKTEGLDVQRRNGKIICESDDSSAKNGKGTCKTDFYSLYSQTVQGILQGLFALPIGIEQTVTLGLSHLLVKDIMGAWTYMKNVPLMVSAPFYGFAAAKSGKIREIFSDLYQLEQPLSVNAESVNFTQKETA